MSPSPARLINAPSLLLADEPTGNLDTRTSHEIMETLRSLNREQGVTIVLVTHEADIAAYADRIVTMRDGKIVSDERVSKPAARRPALPKSIVPPPLNAHLAIGMRQQLGDAGRAERRRGRHILAGKIDPARRESLVEADLSQRQLFDTKEHKGGLDGRTERHQYTMARRGA